MNNYDEFAASTFGITLASVAIDEGASVLTDDLIQRATDKWNLAPSALSAVFQRAESLLSEGPDVVRAAYDAL